MTNHVPRLRITASALAIALIASACSSGAKTASSDADQPGPRGIVAQVASYDLVAGHTGRFIVGLLAADQSRVVSFGTIRVSFAYLGTSQSPKKKVEPTTPVDATFLPIPGQKVAAGSSGPRFVSGSEGVGVYGTENITFDKAGLWRVAAAVRIKGATQRVRATFDVVAKSVIPNVGDTAPPTENALDGSAGISARSIDSRADDSHPIPDPELHSTTIAAALAAHRPLMVVVSTPTYCVSRFCGPITDSVSALAKQFGDRMAFVHLEVWRDYEKSELNKAAAEWIFPAGSSDAREPWVFVVNRDGRITHRFDNVATDSELSRAITASLA